MSHMPAVEKKINRKRLTLTAYLTEQKLSDQYLRGMTML